jgi:predicted aldo/keto reductase-like oxidoreductase
MPLIHRRTFLGLGGLSVAAAACGGSSHGSAVGGPVAITSGKTPAEVERGGGVPKRTLGRTGVRVSMVGIGGYHLGLARDVADSTRMVRSALDRGVDFFDNCWDYHDGVSEERLGRALADGYRPRAFVMTKIDGRTRGAAQDQLEQSLRRLRTDVIDLIQVHEVIRESDPKRCFAENGCMEALVRAKEAGKVRFIGFTGHKDPAIHLAMLEMAQQHGFTFDAVQLPLNLMDAHYLSFEQRVLPVLVDRGIAVLGMKSLASGKILKSGTGVTARECLHYAMSLPTSVVITGCESMRDVDQAIESARSFRPLLPEQLTQLRARTRSAAQHGFYEPFKTSDEHDGTKKHPEWLESA